MRLFIHFGVHKTGSSSIQNALFDNIDDLVDLSYIHDGKANSSLIVNHCFSQKQRIANESYNINRRLKRQALQHFTRAVKRVTAEGNSTAVLSAESISHFTAKDIAALRRFLMLHFEEIKYIGYIRQPVSFLRSAFQQEVQTGMPTFIPRMNSDIRFNKQKTIITLDKIVGQENVIVHPFDQEYFPDGNVVKHFLSQIGQDFEKLDIARDNESLNFLQVKLLFTYRRHFGDEKRNDATYESRHHFLNILRSLESVPFRFHPRLRDYIKSEKKDFYEWAEARLPVPFTEPKVKAADTFIQPQQLIQFSDEDCAQVRTLLDRYDVRDVDLSTPRGMARAVRFLRRAVHKEWDALNQTAENAN